MNEHADIPDFGAIADGTTLIIQRLLPGPVDRVWKYLADGELRRKWLASGDMQLVPGAALELVWRNDDLSATGDHRPDGFPQEQRMQSHVISVDPMRLLTIAWGNGDVTFELRSVADKVLLVVTHRGLDNPDARTMIAAGWHAHLDILLPVISGLEAPSFWSNWTKLKSVYGSRLAQ
ncbi:MAG: SRPBCC family protein [Rhizobium sp.]|nr:SRPBCC family protein [Rhizobium sp.]